MRGNDIIFDLVQLMHYKYRKVNFKRGGSNIDSPDWIKNKKATINPKNEDDKWFQYAATVALNYEEIELHSERVSNFKPFINKYNQEGINYPSKIDDWKTFDKNKPATALNISKKKKYFQLIFQNITREKQIILLMLPNRDLWNCIFLLQDNAIS